MKAIVLAAGKGTRLNSAKENIPKVMREIDGKCLIDYCLGTIDFISKGDTAVVVGFQKEKVTEHLGEEYLFAVQDKQLGTGHAVFCTKELFGETDDDVLVIYGDMPLIKKDTIDGIVKTHKDTGADLTILTAKVKNILPYGRIIRNEEGKVIDIIEEKDTDENTWKINELNVGVIMVKTKYLYEGLSKLKNNNKSGEYYLTDLTKIFVQEGKHVETYITCDEDEIRGVNTIEDLQFAKTILNQRENR